MVSSQLVITVIWLLLCNSRGWLGLSDTLTQCFSRLLASPVPTISPLAYFALSAFLGGCDWVMSLHSPVCSVVLLEPVSVSILGTGMEPVLFLVSSLTVFWSCVALYDVPGDP